MAGNNGNGNNNYKNNNNKKGGQNGQQKNGQSKNHNNGNHKNNNKNHNNNNKNNNYNNNNSNSYNNNNNNNNNKNNNSTPVKRKAVTNGENSTVSLPKSPKLNQKQRPNGKQMMNGNGSQSGKEQQQQDQQQQQQPKTTSNNNNNNNNKNNNNNNSNNKQNKNNNNSNKNNSNENKNPNTNTNQNNKSNGIMEKKEKVIGGSKTQMNRESIAEFRRSLPIADCEENLIEMLEKEDTVLLMGETGSGKTTQIPQFLLAAGYDRNFKQIVITQPRRVAAISVAKRVAQEQNCVLGERVGYTVRFEDRTGHLTAIRYMTDGYLLREAMKDHLLLNFSVIMIDEAHERTVNTDILFGLLIRAQAERRQMKSVHGLKLIIASATMDIDHFSQYFGVPGVYVEGRLHPVRIMHAKEEQPDYEHSTLVTLFEFHRNTPVDHDVLVFLTGQEEIESVCQQIRQIVKCNSDVMPAMKVFPLYAQMPQSRQMECFQPTPPDVRKVVLATNIAETSITIPGVRCVIDAGYIKRRIYNPVTGLEILRTERISQAQAAQRCGRAGRDSPGVCYRIYTKEQLATFSKMEQPEILRSNISSIVLQLLSMSLDCRNFNFLDKPSTDAIDDAHIKLYYLGAIKKFKAEKMPEITPLGKQMVIFPLEPQYSKLILSASKYRCMQEMLNLVAVLSSQDIFAHYPDKEEQIAVAHAKFHSKHGDHLTLLNVFNAFLKTDKIKTWCQDNYMNARNLMYAQEVRQQLLDIVKAMKLDMNSCGNNTDQLRKCLLTGLFDNIAELRHDKGYLTISGKMRAKIHPSSVLHQRYEPQYLVYSEIVLTERNYLRHVTEIRPEWVAEVMPNFMYLNRIKVQDTTTTTS